MKRILLFFVAAVLCVGCMVAQQRERPQLSETTARSFIDRFPDPSVIRWGRDRNHFTWQSGYVLFAMERLWRLTNDGRYLDYVRRFVDQNVGADGSVPNFNPGALDNFLPGYACLLLYEQTGDWRYGRAAETIRHGFDDYPRTAEGMFVHNRGTAQVWVDGVFMGQMFLARYAKTMQHAEDFNEVARQIRGIFRLCGTDDGLLYHGWSPKGHAPWASNADSHSTDVWSEGLGWVAVLLADVFDFLPANHESRAELERLTVSLCEGLAKHQDKRTGLWCQVVQRENDEGNWNETSGSGMFTYLLQRCVDRGLITAEKYRPIIRKAYDGLRTKAVRNADGNVNLIDCSSIGIQDNYRAYITQTREISTYAAFASFILGTGIVEHSLVRW